MEKKIGAKLPKIAMMWTSQVDNKLIAITRPNLRLISCWQNICSCVTVGYHAISTSNFNVGQKFIFGVDMFYALV